MKTVTQIIDEVRETMCIFYCRYTNQSLEAIDNQEELDKLCENCPLNKL